MPETILMQGDCLQRMKEIPDGSVDMVLCDLPYGKTRCKWDAVIPLAPLWEEYRRVTKPHSAIVLFGAEPFSSELRISNLGMWRYDWIWRKDKATQYLNANRRPLCDYEIISVFSRQSCPYYPIMGNGPPYSKQHKPGDGGECYGKTKHSRTVNVTTRYPRTIVEFSVEWKPVHPTQKPVALCEYLVRTYTTPGGGSDGQLHGQRHDGRGLRQHGAAVRWHRKGPGIF